MKHYLKLLALLVLLNLSSCQQDKEKAFLKGTFTNSAKGEFSVADDTLIVEPAEGNNFIIHRRTGYNRIENGKLGKESIRKKNGIRSTMRLRKHFSKLEREDSLPSFRIPVT